MSVARQIRVSTEIAAAQADVWSRVSDHEATPTWVAAVKAVTLVREGRPRNGLGAIRVVRFKPVLWTDIHEEVVDYEAPASFHYVLFKGMPGLLSHLGKVCVDDLGDGRSRLRWEVDFVFRTWHPFRLFLPVFLRDFEAVLTRALADLKAQMEQAAPAR